MRDVIPKDAADGIGAGGDESAARIRESLDGQYVCPFCGTLGETPDGLCARCSMENTAASRKATKIRIGPWYVYQHRNPAAPGMKFQTLLTFVQKGKVKPRTVVRGPTTHQLWRFAAHVKGLSREFGVCFSCGGSITPTTNICPNCNRLQEPPITPDVLLEGDPDPERAVASAPRAASESPRAASARSAAFRAPEPDLDQDDFEPPASEERGRARRAMDEPAQRKPTREASLSPRELAAAFNLDFTPKKGAREPEARRRGQPARRKPRRWIPIFTLLVLLAMAAGAGVLAYRPDLRAQAQQHGMEAWKRMLAMLAPKPAVAKPAPHGAANDLAVSEQLRDSHSLARPDSGARGGVKNAFAAPSNASAPSTRPGSEIAMTQSKAAAPNVKTNSSPKESSSPRTQPVPSKSALPPEPAPEMDLVEAAEKAKSLYDKGIDAEQRVDFSSAVNYYEQIMKLPRDTWPTDLELRLKLARAQAGQK